MSPPLPPTVTHPLYKTPISTAAAHSPSASHSTIDQKPAHYLLSSAAPKNFTGTNPWEREEREKEHEYRREQARQWREYQIIELSGIQNRTGPQEEQLKTLVLERDFERLAQEQGDDEDNDTHYVKDNIQEVIRLAQAPVTNMKQLDIKMNVVSQPSSFPISSNSEMSTMNPNEMSSVSSSLSQQPHQQSNGYLSIMQPKSILKHNSGRTDGAGNNNIGHSHSAAPSKQAKTTSFADTKTAIPDSIMPASSATVSNVVRDLSNLSFNDNEPNFGMTMGNYHTHETLKNASNNNHDIQAMRLSESSPPPPPERNSSFAIMSQKHHDLKLGPIAANKPTIKSVVVTSKSSLASDVDNDNNNVHDNNSNRNNDDNKNNNIIHNDDESITDFDNNEYIYATDSSETGVTREDLNVSNTNFNSFSFSEK